tara:strand:+ start:122 stop:568 length:447 start_codon:yes stop_codon:yes gene_type:complete
MKHIYYYDEYFKDISKLVVRYSRVKNPHIVSASNQSLPAAVHISNLLKCPMSVLDGSASWVINNTENKEIRPEDCPLFPFLICIDAIYREDVFTDIKMLPEFIQNPDYSFYAIFGHNNDLRVHYSQEMVYKEIELPWQRMLEKNDLVI